MTEHLNALTKQKHINKLLQSIYNKHQTFEFDIMAYEDDLTKLASLEQTFLDAWFGEDECANLNPFADRPKGMIGHKHSEEAKKRMSAAAKTRKRKPHSEETKAKMSEARKFYYQTKQGND